MLSPIPRSECTAFTFQERWEFLFPRRPRYILYPPDLLGTRWTLWDLREKRSVCFGQTAWECVDWAIPRCPDNLR